MGRKKWPGTRGRSGQAPGEEVARHLHQRRKKWPGTYTRHSVKPTSTPRRQATSRNRAGLPDFRPGQFFVSSLRRRRGEPAIPGQPRTLTHLVVGHFSPRRDPRRSIGTRFQRDRQKPERADVLVPTVPVGMPLLPLRGSSVQPMLSRPRSDITRARTREAVGSEPRACRWVERREAP
jgi:hypothetical protein